MAIEGMNDPPDKCGHLLLVDWHDVAIQCMREEDHSGPHVGLCGDVVLVEQSTKEAK